MNLKNRSNKRRLLPALIALVLMISGLQSRASSVLPVNLQCEYRSNPLGIDETAPRLSWQIKSNERDQGQAAYEILVAGSTETLEKNRGDRWDSGKVASDETANVVYVGNPLTSGAPCFWKVRVWDKSGRASAWSAAARWSMGLLADTDWQGQWIGWDERKKADPLAGAKWIWFPEGDPIVSAPICTRHFRRVFELPADQVVRTATITMTADDQFKLYVNGQEAGGSDSWSQPGTFAIGTLLKPGKNILAVVARNVGDNPSPAGLVGRLIVVFEQGPAFTLDTDNGWKSAVDAGDEWKTVAFDESPWAGAKVLGDYGVSPWGLIGNDDRRLPARYLRREFTADKKIQRATAYVCGLGISELYLNGKKVGNDLLSPALSEYEKRAFYLTYDVTDQLQRGDNALGIILGNGRFFSPRSGMRNYGFPKLRMQMNIEYADGTTTQIVSDASWKLTTAGPIRANNEYDGEDYDARMEMPGWCQSQFNDSQWQPVQIVEPGAPVLSAQIGEPIRAMETLHPVALTNPKPGVYIFDLGQNIGGWCRLQVSGPRGTVVKLRHAESLNADGTLYTANLRTAKAEDVYTLKGAGTETYEPRFTHHGFRFVEVTGFPRPPTLSSLEGRLVCDAVPPVGQLACSNPLLNQIAHNIFWTIRDNYRTMPTDLPRDEREGWMGDRQEVSKGETYLFNAAPLYAQWLTDIQDDQHANGSVPDVSPAYWSLYQDGVVWASTYIIVPSMLYDQYGDLGVLQKHYDSMKKWTDYMASFLKDDVMPQNTYADWCFPPRLVAEMTVINSRDPKLTTSGTLMSTAIFYHDLQLMARSARLLGKTADAEQFDAVAERIKTAFNRRFYDAKAGYYDNDTQTSAVLPLAFGMVPDENKTNVIAHLVNNITVGSDNHLGTGLIGGHYLMRVLSDNGRPDLAYAIATQTTYPSWGYMVSKGATTIWELWNGDTADAGMNSRNIVMMIGDLNIWLYGYVAGIRPDPAGPGFKKIIIKPEVIAGLTWAKADYDSIRGRISSEWHKSDEKFDLRITIPANTTATVYLPATNLEAITEKGRALEKTFGVKSSEMQNGRAVMEVGSGDYHFVARQ